MENCDSDNIDGEKKIDECKKNDKKLPAIWSCEKNFAK